MKIISYILILLGCIWLTGCESCDEAEYSVVTFHNIKENSYCCRKYRIFIKRVDTSTNDTVDMKSIISPYSYSVDVKLKCGYTYVLYYMVYGGTSDNDDLMVHHKHTLDFYLSNPITVSITEPETYTFSELPNFKSIEIRHEGARDDCDFNFIKYIEAATLDQILDY